MKNVSPQISYPINLKISDSAYTLMTDAEHELTYDLKKGVMLGGENFGFSIIILTKRKQKEYIYIQPNVESKD